MRTEPRLRNGVIYEAIYEIISYEDSETLNTIVIDKFIKAKFPDAGYVYILHDKDINDDGTPKKAHTHHLIKFEREKSINVVAKELGIEVHNINWKADWDGSVQYLIHKNHPEKYQYDKSCLNSNIDISMALLSRQDRKQAHDEAEMLELSVIVDYIASKSGMLSLYEIYCFCIDNEIWSTYRRNYSIIKDMLHESKEAYKHSKTYWYKTL